MVRLRLCPVPRFPDEHRWQFADTLSVVKGRHAIKFGFDVNLVHDVLINLFQGEGVYSYTGAPAVAFANWVADDYDVNLGDGRTGKHYTSFTQATDPITHVGRDDFWDKNIAGFVEDSWRVLPNLTVNLGLRYEIQDVPSSPHPNTNTPLLAALTSHINTDSNNFGPRIEIAWQPFQKPCCAWVTGCSTAIPRTARSMRCEWKRNLPAANQLPANVGLRAYFPEPDFHASRSHPGRAIPGSGDAAGDQHQSIAWSSGHARPSERFRESAGP